jgi:hypothetical protein
MDSGVRTLWLAKLGSRSLRQYKTRLLGCCPRARDDLLFWFALPCSRSRWQDLAGSVLRDGGNER